MGGWHHSLSHQDLGAAAVLWGSGAVRAPATAITCQDGVLGGVLSQKQPSLDRVPSGVQLTCACCLSQSVGRTAKGGLLPSKTLPWLLQQLLRDACKESSAASGCRDNVSAQKSPPHPWQTALPVAPRHKPACCPLELSMQHPLSSQRLGKSFGVCIQELYC